MDNQQTKIEDTELAWLGGFIDGEGSLCMMRTNCGKFKTNGDMVGGFAPRLTIANTDFKTLGYICEIVDKVGLPYHIDDNTDRPSRKEFNKPSWHFSVQGLKRMTRWLAVIFPYLRTKRPQAELLLEYSLSRMAKARNSPLDAREKQILDIFRNPQSSQRLNALKGSRNTRGTQWYSPTPGESQGGRQK